MDAGGYVIFGYPATNVILVSLLAICGIYLLYWLWTWPCGDKKDGDGRVRKYDTLLPEQSVKPLYALELEPGIVVLQSEDGEFFRILREYDSADRRGYGSTATDVPANVNESHHYIPSYTRAHFQTRPTAPSMSGDAQSTSQPRLDPFGDGAAWAPIQTLGKES